MIVINVPNDKLIDDEGYPTKPWQNFFDQTTQQMQQSLSNEGFWIPAVSSASSSVTPPTSGGQVAQLEASYGQQNGVNLGTLIYDPNDNQLKVLLSDSPTTATFKTINHA